MTSLAHSYLQLFSRLRIIPAYRPILPCFTLLQSIAVFILLVASCILQSSVYKFLSSFLICCTSSYRCAVVVISLSGLHLPWLQSFNYTLLICSFAWLLFAWEVAVRCSGAVLFNAIFTHKASLTAACLAFRLGMLLSVVGKCCCIACLCARYLDGLCSDGLCRDAERCIQGY